MPKLMGTVLLLLMVLPLFFGACSPNGIQSKKHTVTVAGSTSVMPFTEKLAEHFMVDHPDFVVDVQGGGSTAGIQACLNNTVNIGMSSRQLKDEEKHTQSDYHLLRWYFLRGESQKPHQLH